MLGNHPFYGVPSISNMLPLLQKEILYPSGKQ